MNLLLEKNQQIHSLRNIITALLIEMCWLSALFDMVSVAGVCFRAAGRIWFASCCTAAAF